MVELEKPTLRNARKGSKRIHTHLGWLTAVLALLVPHIAIQVINDHRIERIETRYRISLERFHDLMTEKKEMPK